MNPDEDLDTGACAVEARRPARPERAGSSRLRVVALCARGERLGLEEGSVAALAAGLSIRAAGAAETAHRLLQSGRCDLLAVSYRLLGEGSEAPVRVAEMAELAERAQGVPVVVVAAPCELADGLALLRAGAEEVIAETVTDPGELARRLLFAYERRRLGQASRRAHERAHLALEGAREGVWDWDHDQRELFVSQGFHQLLGGRGELAAVGLEWWTERVHPEDRDRFQSSLAQHLDGPAGEESFACEHRLRCSDGSFRWVLARGLALLDRRGGVRRMVGTVGDVTARRAAEEKLLYAALHDTLSGLPNRSLFLDRLRVAMAQLERRPEHRFAVLFLDVDRFKRINDTFGHERGDRLLVQIARRLESLVRPNDRVARFGGDEFAVLADGLVGIDDATRVALRLIERLSEPYELGGEQVCTSVSVGVCLSDSHYQTPEEMLHDADTAMYRVKARGGEGFELFDPTGDSVRRGEMGLETELRGALEREELRVLYQPIVELASGRITGFEALVRWQHPRRGLLAPEEFVPVAERSGIIHRIGEFVLQTACRQAADWQRRFPRAAPLTISVNVSGRELMRTDLVERVAHQIRSSGLCSGSLRLEITESSVMDHSELAIDQLRGLRALDVELDLDDFGTGYCSLSYLQRIPTGTLKIDRSFVERLDEGGGTSHIVEAIVRLAHQLGLRVAAEGLETETQVQWLRELACTHGQGFYFARPVEAAAAEVWLAGDESLQPN
ncbi:MAG TPA: EAL domain-containing protein [Thermoanaerobaculia bacterium]|nr:EAL domain-containing protein [Thermoanaerobaculia bacterium]